jgi:hypothetical protein
MEGRTVADKDDDLFDSVSAMAERMGLKGSERRRYIHEHMTRSGYRAEPTYVRDDGDDDDDDNGSGFFAGKRRQGRRDDDRSSRRRRDDDDWYS